MTDTMDCPGENVLRKLRDRIAELESENADLKQRLKTWNCGANSSAVLLAEKQRDRLASAMRQALSDIRFAAEADAVSTLNEALASLGKE